MVWVPTARSLVVMLNWLFASRVPLPRLVPVVVSTKLTEPATGRRVLADSGVTVAVKVTESPTTEGFSLDFTVVLVPAGLTVRVTRALELALKLLLARK